VDGDCIVETSHTAWLDVDVAARLEANRPLGIPRTGDGLVQTHGRLQLFLEFGVLLQIVVKEGLLDHGQIELVHFSEEADILKRIACVAVDVEGLRREGAAHRPQHVEVPTRTHFKLDAREAAIEGAPYLRQQRVDGVFHTEVRAHIHGRAGSSEQFV